MRGWTILAVLSVGLLTSQAAFAARAATRERQAKKACLSGDYATGVSILAELYVDTNDPTYLYNQGRCYEQNVRYVEAAERFREYLRKAEKLSAADKAEVNKHIEDCEAAIARARPPEPAPTMPPPQPQPVPTPPPPAAPLVPTGPGAGAVHTGPEPQARSWQHTAKWVASGAAVAFLGLGIAEHVSYYGKNHDYNDNPDCGGPGESGSCKSLADSADTAQTVAIVGYGAAVVATGLAVTFWLTDKPAPEPAPSAGLSLTCAPALAGVSCAGRF